MVESGRGDTTQAVLSILPGVCISVDSLCDNVATVQDAVTNLYACYFPFTASRQDGKWVDAGFDTEI